jgi:hypothetical protein
MILSKSKKEKIQFRYRKMLFFSEPNTGKLREEPLAIQRALQSMEVRKGFRSLHASSLGPIRTGKTGMKN